MNEREKESLLTCITIFLLGFITGFIIALLLEV